MRTNSVTRTGAIILALILVLLLVVPVASAAPPLNDSFGGATIISLPYNATLDTSEATADASDPVFCTSPQEATVWFALTPADRLLITINASFDNGSTPAIIVVTGAPGAFNNVACSWPSVQFAAAIGQTYYIMVGRLPGSYPAPGGNLTLAVDGAPLPQPQANFYFYPSDPSTFDTIQFCDSSYDPAWLGFQSWAWNFGDGTTAEGYCQAHQYAAVGDYTVQLMVTTVDGRTASASQVVHVANHDVAIARFSVPKSARVNQTRQIAVSIASKQASETVQVELYKSVPGTYDGFQWIGGQQLLVPARTSNRTVTVNFGYTFTGDDANIGKVTFKAVVWVLNGRDALPGDNEVRATTRVTR